MSPADDTGSRKGAPSTNGRRGDRRSAAARSDQRGDARATAEVRLRRVNQRLTNGRAELVSVLMTAAGPLTTAEILDECPGLAQSSAYRNLVVLEAAGVLHRVVTRDGFARFELAEDLTGHHHHLVCEECGRVEDLAAAAGLERALERTVVDAHERHGFVVEEHRLDLFGRCADCR